jgi:hypothetical protein
VGSNPTGAMHGDVAQRQEHSLVRRARAGSSPVVPALRRKIRPASRAMMSSRRSIPLLIRFVTEPKPEKPASAHGGRGVTAASEVVILEVPVRIRPTALRQDPARGASHDDLSAFDLGIEPWVADAGKSRYRRAVLIGPRVWFRDLDAGAESRRITFLSCER